MKRYRIISSLLALLFALSTAVSFSANIENQHCPESASCVTGGPDLGWLEKDKDKDGNDLELLPFDTIATEFNRSETNRFSGQYSQLEYLPHSYSQIRAPPPLL